MSISVFGFTLIRVRKLDGLRAEHGRLREESQRQIEDLTERLHQAGEQLKAATSSAGNHDTGSDITPDPEPPADGGVAVPPPVVGELISLADGVVDLTGTSAPPGPEHATAILSWIEARTQSLLTACGVARIEDRGLLDLRRHEVVAGRAAPDDGLIDHIADIVRPGYEWCGTLVRSQQVIAYVPASEVVELVPRPRPPEIPEQPGWPPARERRPPPETTRRAERDEER
jgi:hypothetical protein